MSMSGVPNPVGIDEETNASGVSGGTVEPILEFTKSDQRLYQGCICIYKKSAEKSESENEAKASCCEKLFLACSCDFRNPLKRHPRAQSEAASPQPASSQQSNCVVNISGNVTTSPQPASPERHNVVVVSRGGESTTAATVTPTQTAEFEPWYYVIFLFRNMRTRKTMTSDLRYANATGTKLHKMMAFPLVRNAIRDVWVSTELLFTLVGLALSIASFSLGNDAAFNILHLVLAIVSTILACIDGFVNLRTYKSCRERRRIKKNQVAPSSDENHRQETSSAIKEEQMCKGRCKKRFRDASDILRIILAELILYPLVVCDMFKFVIGQGWKAENAVDYVNFILFIISSFELLAYVYIIRLFVLGGMIMYVQRKRHPRTKDGSKVSDHDDTISKAALRFQFYFFVHVLLQMVVQILMLISIGTKFQYDNRNLLLNPNSNSSSSIHISPYLWYMLVAGYIMPICGLLTFFIVAYYWVQEFPIGLCIDLLRLLEIPRVDIILFPKDSTKHHCSTVGNVMKFFDTSSNCELKKEFKKMQHDTAFLSKLSYPFKSPVLIVLCCLYTACQIGFFACCATTETGVVLLNEEWGPLLYIFLLVPISLLANLCTFLVAGIWIIIIPTIIGIVVLAIAVVITIILLVVILLGSVVIIVGGITCGYCGYCCAVCDD